MAIRIEFGDTLVFGSVGNPDDVNTVKCREWLFRNLTLNDPANFIDSWGGSERSEIAPQFWSAVSVVLHSNGCGDPSALAVFLQRYLKENDLIATYCIDVSARYAVADDGTSPPTDYSRAQFGGRVFVVTADKIKTMCTGEAASRLIAEMAAEKRQAETDAATLAADEAMKASVLDAANELGSNVSASICSGKAR